MNPPQPQNPLTMTVKEAAALIGVGQNQAASLVRSGKIRSVRMGRRWLITREAVEAFLRGEK